MEFKVKEVSPLEEKSVQEVEKNLLDKHEEKLNDEQPKANKEQKADDEPKSNKPAEIKDEDVLSYIKNRYNKEISSIDELFSQREVNNDLPEDVSKYLNFKKETGRGFNDFVKANKSYDDLNDDQVLAEYYSLTEEDLDNEDIHYLVESKFSYDEDIDDDSEIKKKSIAKKRELSKAKKYLNDFKEKYSVPLESSGKAVSNEIQEELNAYKKFIQESKTVEEANQKKNEYFSKKTNEVFNSEFKGFEFKVGDKKIGYSYGDAQEMKAKQMNLESFIGKYVGDDGLISDANGWHKALSAAMDPERFAQYFYEQGKSDGVGNISKKSKNINMNVRNTPQVIGETGFKARAVGEDKGKGLRIKSKNK
tara:strand:+ start:5703 stop:6794 length:1092 start_codon:yes stop_codon:yes gene_type:complete